MSSFAFSTGSTMMLDFSLDEISSQQKKIKKAAAKKEQPEEANKKAAPKKKIIKPKQNKAP